MANRFYQPGEERGAQVRALFSRISHRYDLLNDLQSFGRHRAWKRTLVDLAQIRPGERVLDVCCGTGDLSFEMARRGAEVTGVDFTGEMLAVAAKRIPRERLTGPAPVFVRGDAQALGFPADSFDVVTVGYGLRNLGDWQKGLGEMWRVARPGGRILTLDFGKPRNALWRQLYFWHLALSVPLVGKIFAGNKEAYGYILESLKTFPAQEGIAAEMRSLGGEDVAVKTFWSGVMAVNFGRKPW